MCVPPFAVLPLAALLALPARAGAEASAMADPGTAPFVIDGGDLEAGGSAASPRPIAASVEALTSLPATQRLVAETPRPLAFVYSDGYLTRNKVHKYASFATLPVFVAQFAVGQSLYNGSGSDGLRTAHGALVGATAALFAVNTATGVWNYKEARKDPNGRGRRTLHGILMAVADVGFVASGVLAPEGDEHEAGAERESGGVSRSTHRAIAVSSMGIATVGYLLMLLGR